MADLALSYSKTALDFVVNKVQTAIKEEEEQWQTVQRDLVFITGEFEMMQSFLNTADGERLRSLVVRTWVQQVRDLSYDVEDSIDFVLQLNSGERPWWLRLLPSWMKKAPEAPVDEAVAEITQLKAQVVDVSRRNTRYNLVTDSGAKPPASRILGSSLISTNDVPDIAKVFNMKDMSLRVICAVSETVGDVGTLLFIRGVYKETGKAFPRRAWVKLMHPFNPNEFIRSLLAQFLCSSCEEAEGEKVLGVQVLRKMEEIQLMDAFVHEVNTQNYIIVLEGVSSMEEWDAIKTYLPDRMNASRIIVWTHHVEIATICTGVPYRAFAIRQTSPDHPSYVFYRADSDEAACDDLIVEGYCPCPEKAPEILALLRARNIMRVAVWGPPHSGKTELVGAVYDHVKAQGGSISAGGFTQLAWADVPNSFAEDGVDDIARGILWGLTRNTWNGGDLVTTCQFVLSRNSTGRTLVVLDGVRSIDDWERINKDLGLGELQYGKSCVVVITEDEGVANHVGHVDWGPGPFVVRVTDSEAKSVEEQTTGAGAPLHGRHGESNELVRALLDKNSRCVAVWGPPGVGKTTLVRSVYDRMEVRDYNDHDHFMQRGWANVPDPFVDIVGVSRDLTSGMHRFGYRRRGCGGGDGATDWPLFFRSSVGRTLLVFDGVRSKEDWDRINAEITGAMEPESCVVVITDDESVAAQCVGTSHVDHVLRVNPLGAAAALGLFIEKKAELRDDGGNLSVQECRWLSSKCGGLPKFIVTIAGYLGRFDRARCVSEMRLLNDNFIHQLQNKPEYDCLKYVLPLLHSKFDGSPQLLKKCIFYLSLFPRDPNIRRKRLVRRWIAEGYCSNEEADNLIGKVRDLCLIQPWETVVPVPSAMSKTSCQVNYSFLDYIFSRQSEEKTFLPLEFSVLDGRSNPPTNRVGQHLAIRRGWVRDKAAYSSMDFSRLRSLTASGEWKPFFIPQKMRVLRVLDMEDTSNLKDDDLDEIGKLMPRLKFLSLRRCKSISRLPESLGDLLLLETLDIRDTKITVLPKTITKLQKLQHIRAGKTQWCSSGPDVQEPAAAPTPASCPETQVEPSSWRSTLSACLCKTFGSTLFPCLCKSGSTGGVGVPQGMGGMKALQTLGVVDVDMPGGKALLAELRKMKKKEEERKKNKNKNKKKDAESHPLLNLSLCGLDWSRHLLHCISSQDQLESLSLRAETLQVDHFNLPPNIVKFRLDVAGILQQGAVDAIKHHESLQTLRLHAKEVEDGAVHFCLATKAEESEGGSFSKVKILEISCSSSVHVKFSQQGMQKLELLKVHCHRGSPLEISGLDQLGALKQVWVAGSCDNALKEALERQLSKHPKNPALYMEEQSIFENVMEEQGSS